MKEIDEIVVEMHSLLWRENAKVIGVAYARYSCDYQFSIADQIRGIFELAVAKGIFIPRENIYFDLSVRGSKDRRAGLNQVRATLQRKSAKTLIVFATNRLYRKQYKAIKFVEEEVVSLGLDCYFVVQGIYTDPDGRWRMPLQLHGMMDEHSATMYASQIRAGHIGLFLKRFVVTTLPYGYMGQDVPDAFTKRQFPRQIIVIDPETSVWVIQIFKWYVEERLPMARIVERLNEQNVPCGPKSDGSLWSPHALHYLLTNTCYRGWWSYGKGKSVWQCKADYSKRVLRDKPLKEIQFEELRLVSDQMWYQAQKLLAASPQRNAGRKPIDTNAVPRPRVLNGLLICKEHNWPLKVGGNYGQNMFCSKCRMLPKAMRHLYTYINRAQALKCISRAIAVEIRKDCRLVRELLVPVRDECETFQTGDTRSLEAARTRVEKLTKQIQFTLDNPGESESDQAESRQKLKHFRAERATHEAVIARHDEASRRTKRLPTEDDLEKCLAEIEEVLFSTASGRDPVNAGAVRQILELVTGERIELEQMGERLAYRGWLRARFTVRLLETCSAKLGLTCPLSSILPREVFVDIREETVAEQNAARAVELYEGGMLVTGIASALGIDRHQVTEALKIHCTREGLPPPEDGRARRAKLPDKLLNPPICQQIAEEVKQLMDQGLLMEQIAEAVGYTRDTVREALRYWYQQRGLPMPDMRNRRKELEIKNRPRKDSTEP